MVLNPGSSSVQGSSPCAPTIEASVIAEISDQMPSVDERPPFHGPLADPLELQTLMAAHIIANCPLGEAA